MQKLQKKDDIYAVVQFGFKNFALLARKNIKNNWNKFSFCTLFIKQVFRKWTLVGQLYCQIIYMISS